MSNRVLKFIELIRGAPAAFEGCDPDDTSANIVNEIFTQGNCGNFALALQTAFGGQLLMDRTCPHIACEIDGRIYDIRGDVTHLHNCMTPTTEEEVRNRDFVDNYSFAERGPIC